RCHRTPGRRYWRSFRTSLLKCPGRGTGNTTNCSARFPATKTTQGPGWCHYDWTTPDVHETIGKIGVGRLGLALMKTVRARSRGETLGVSTQFASERPSSVRS